MNKIVKRYLLVCVLVAQSFCMYGGSEKNEGVWAAMVGFFFGESQQKEQQVPSKKEENNERAPKGVTIDDYIAQLRYDLNGAYSYNKSPVIPWSEVDAIDKAVRRELRGVNLQNRDYVNQAMSAVLISHVEGRTEAILRSIEPISKEWRLSSQEKETIKLSMGRNIAVRLESLPHINGEALAQFFGENLEAVVYHLVLNRTGQHFSPLHQPMPSAPPINQPVQEYISHQTECPACLEEFSSHGVQRITLIAADRTKRCGHAMCSDCVLEWTKQHNSCPLCRAEIDKQDLSSKLHPRAR